MQLKILRRVRDQQSCLIKKIVIRKMKCKGGVAIFVMCCKWQLQISSLQQIIYFHNVNEKKDFNFLKGLKGIISQTPHLCNLVLKVITLSLSCLVYFPP